jgi:hypothetical protein
LGLLLILGCIPLFLCAVYRVGEICTDNGSPPQYPHIYEHCTSPSGAFNIARIAVAVVGLIVVTGAVAIKN